MKTPHLTLTDHDRTTLTDLLANETLAAPTFNRATALVRLHAGERNFVSLFHICMGGPCCKKRPQTPSDTDVGDGKAGCGVSRSDGAGAGVVC
jgi:hypothetical protein